VTRTRAITTDEDQRVTFVELFFDLVFVYAVTQLVALLHHELSWAGAARAVLVFWLVWWAWTQFTWALNSADTTHPGVELSVLVATAVVFLMAVVLPDAFSGGGAWFAITLFVIIALGESLIVAAAGLSGAERTAHTVAVGVLAVAGTCGLWWTYFGWAKSAIDRAVAEHADPARTILARDVYSVLHFPVVFGIVLYAVAIEEAVAHSDEPLSAGTGIALAAGITLFLGGTAAALWRAGHRALIARPVILASVLAGLWATRDAAATWSLMIAICGVTAVAAVEQLALLMKVR
jgi:low temperature requirement protein LtrA